MCNKWYKVLDSHFALSAIAVVYYTYILYVITSSRSPALRSHYFRIYVVTGVFDIIGVIALEHTREDMMIGFGSSFESMTRLTMSLTGTNSFTHIFGCFLMTLNRFTAVHYPLHYDKIWTNRTVNALLLADIMVSFAAYIPTYSVPFIYELRDGCWSLKGRSEPIQGTRIMSSSVTLLYELASIMLISLTIYGVRQKIDGNHSRMRKELGLILVTTINCALSTFECIYDVSFLLNINIESVPFLKWVTDQYDAYFFLIMTTNAYSIVFLSRSVREEILRRWSHRSFITGRSITITMM